MNALKEKYGSKVEKERRVDGEAPQVLVDMMLPAIDIMAHDCKGKKVKEGGEWKSDGNKGKYNVEWCMMKGISNRRWRISWEAEGSDPETVFSQICDWGQRLEWDKAAISWGVYPKRWASPTGEHDFLDAELNTSYEVGGGVVSSRAFPGIRFTKFYKDDSGKTNKIFSVFEGIDFSKTDQVKATPFEGFKTKLVTAYVYPGSGVFIETLPNGKLYVGLLCHFNIGGWLPVSLINSTTGTEFLKLAKNIDTRVAVTSKRKEKADKKQQQQQTSKMELPKAENGRKTIRIRPPGSTDEARISWKYA
eukprot:TRINITY_DN3378_c1_g1_i1.p1 TRINITY_DN3378_c1_g1~~TRINITY_DN3378_c1_g1_i1.p1  ORF type:complete len:305 (+),score=42.37 TRINITY_DN3378_c1_g1_i1:43-957(+)